MSDSQTNGRALRIVVPVFNEGSTLATRLKALAPLRARGAELLMVDGGSTDDTWAIACPILRRHDVEEFGKGSRDASDGVPGLELDELLLGRQLFALVVLGLVGPADAVELRGLLEAVMGLSDGLLGR